MIKGKTMKIYISQPLVFGLNDDGISANKADLKIREETKRFLERWFGQKIKFPYFLVANDAKNSQKYDIAMLAGAISRLAECQLAVFLDGWSNNERCSIEHQICRYYGIPVLEMKEDGSGWK